ncbi:MAG: TIGR02757 family protein [Bacteroidia bacterium]|nr:TIGR02757 family protein [Bacteroidia bacterium]
MLPHNIKEILDAKVQQYECPDFIENDPISIPHRFSSKEDIEISGFLAATLAWGNRKAIIKSANEMMRRFDNAPADFVLNASESEIDALQSFVYRTFKDTDLPCFVRALRHIYKEHGGLESVFAPSPDDNSIRSSIINLRNTMLPFLDPHTQKHVPNLLKESAAKRICMYLRWMVRPNDRGVDFGLWQSIKKENLVLPLDVHVGNVALNLGFITKNGKDWKTAMAITNKLREFRPDDPVAYDFALFSMDME